MVKSTGRGTLLTLTWWVGVGRDGGILLGVPSRLLVVPWGRVLLGVL